MNTPRSTRAHAYAGAVHLMRIRGLVTESDGRITAVADEAPMLYYYANSIGHWLAPADRRDDRDSSAEASAN